MAYVRKPWRNRAGIGLNKFSVTDDPSDPARKVIVPAPDSITESGTPLNARNMNDLEDRIYMAFGVALEDKGDWSDSINPPHFTVPGIRAGLVWRYEGNDQASWRPYPVYGDTFVSISDSAYWVIGCGRASVFEGAFDSHEYFLNSRPGKMGANSSNSTIALQNAYSGSDPAFAAPNDVAMKVTASYHDGIAVIGNPYGLLYRGYAGTAPPNPARPGELYEYNGSSATTWSTGPSETVYVQPHDLMVCTGIRYEDDRFYTKWRRIANWFQPYVFSGRIGVPDVGSNVSLNGNINTIVSDIKSNSLCLFDFTKYSTMTDEPDVRHMERVLSKGDAYVGTDPPYVVRLDTITLTFANTNGSYTAVNYSDNS